MQKNVGGKDKTIRLALGGALLVLSFIVGSWLVGIIGLVLLGTGLMGFCPAYLPFGIDTSCSKE